MKAIKATIKWVVAIVIICLAAYFLASINGLTVSRTLLTVNGEKVSEGEYKYYLEIQKSQMLSEAGKTEDDKDFWDSEIDGKKASEVAKEKALENVIRAQIAVIKANEAGIALTDAEKTEANKITTASDSATKTQLEEIKKLTGLDKYQIADVMEKSYLTQSYYTSLSTQENSPIAVDESKIAPALNDKYACVKHVLIMNAPQEETEGIDTASYAEEAKKKAEEVLKKAVDGADFDALIKEYGEDPGMESNPEGYIIDEEGASVDGSGKMVEEFTKGSFAVAAGEVNPQLVESTYGWHIIKRCALPTEGETYDQMVSALRATETNNAFEAYLDSFKDSLNIEIKDYYHKMKVN